MPLPLRLAFVGQRVFFELCSLEEPADDVHPAFIDFRHGADPRPLRERLDALDPDVVFVWRPEIVPPGVLHGLRAKRIGYLTEPLPRDGNGADPHPDLALRLSHLRAADPANFDLILSFDPLIVPTVQQLLPVWRSLPIPVADRVYTDEVKQSGDAAQIAFVGRSTAHREEFLGPAKHDFDVIHIAHGFTGDFSIGLGIRGHF